MLEALWCTLEGIIKELILEGSPPFILMINAPTIRIIGRVLILSGSSCLTKVGLSTQEKSAPPPIAPLTRTIIGNSRGFSSSWILVKGTPLLGFHRRITDKRVE